MKKSNKILLGGFLTVIFTITGLHVAIYAKYKNGNYTVYQPEDKDQKSMKSFTGVSSITIRNGAAEISFGDAVSVEKGKEGFFQYVQKGDSLVISSKSEDDQQRNRGLVKLILPYNVTLSAYNSNISINKGKESSNANPTIFLYNSHAVFAASGRSVQLGHIKLSASDNSRIFFDGDTKAGRLEVELKNSSLEEHEGDFGQLSITTDSTSQLTLQSKHLLKAKITSIPNNP